MFQLVIQYRLSPFFCLNSQRSGDVDSLMAEHLQGKLNSTVLGLAHATMRQFLNQFRLSSAAVLNYEIKRSVRHLLSHDGMAMPLFARFALSLNKIGGTSEESSSKLDSLRSVCTIFA